MIRMTKEQLEEKHPIYLKNIDDWTFYELAYEGGKDFIEEAIGEQSVRESYENYQSRIKDAVNFNYAGSIVDLFNFYLTEKPAIRDLTRLNLENDELWKMFLRDVDLNNTDFSFFMNEAQKKASVTGALGILVNKHSTDARVKKEEIANGIYPYCAAYTLPHIYDWTFKKNTVSGRPDLVYLKLHDDDGFFHIWRIDRWETWEIPETNKKFARLVASGVNPIREIPFVWLPNLKSITSKIHGKSDIVDVSRICASIVRNISSGEEIIKFAGFPMMRKPMETEDGEKSADQTGPSAIQEFNPEHGEAGKPDWMETKIQEPIEAILDWTDRKIDEIFRVSHLSGVHGQRKSNNEVASGLALRYEFQQLTSVLSAKADNLSETERQIVRLWMKWQGRGKDYKDEDAEIKRQKNFSVDDLSADLDNLIKSMECVISDKFKRKTQQKVVRMALPDLTDLEKKEIDSEIDNADLNVDPEPDKDKKAA